MSTTPTPVSAPSPTNSTTSPPSPVVAVPPVSSSPPPPTTPVVPPPTITPVIPTPTSTPPPVVSPPSPPPPTTTPSQSPPTPVSPEISPPAPSTPDVPSSTPPPPSSKSPPSPPSPPSPSGSTPTPKTPGSRDTPTPPAIGRSPPRPASSTPPPPESSSGISTSLVVGVAIGGVVVLVVLTLLFICCKKKKRRNHGPMDYYGGPPPPKEGPYGAQQQQWSYNVPPPPPANHVVSIPPKLTPPPGAASRLPQSTSSSVSIPPLPPPPFMSSGDSGSNYSDYESPHPPPPPPPAMSLGFSKSTFTYEELVRATDGFSDANLLGQGGFGYVHKGILPNGKEVAVKHLKLGSGQGEREFQAEVEIISRVHHKHLVSLVGYCSTGSQRMLVYEFVPNNTMEFHLHGKGRPTMDWATRLKIALGSAKGLAYLHEDCHPKIIHRDIKAANILLDMKFEAKVADFGLAKFSSDTNTHVSTRVMGTFGYLAPEYAASGKLTEKSDVFSYGVMLLELISGRRPVDTTNSYMDDSLVDWARPVLQRALEEDSDEAYDILVDQRLQSYNHNEMKRMVACAAASVRHSARRRPQMSQIVRALEGDASISDLNEGTKPGHKTVYSSHDSSEYDTFQYNEDMKKFRKVALNSTEYGSSEYSAPPTSEYGLYPSGSSSEGQTTREMSRRTKKDSQGF